MFISALAHSVCTLTFSFSVCMVSVNEKILDSKKEHMLLVGGEHIAMAMVVVGHICTQNIMVVHNIIY